MMSEFDEPTKITKHERIRPRSAKVSRFEVVGSTNQNKVGLDMAPTIRWKKGLVGSSLLAFSSFTLFI
jgi:hypothetical protein